MAHAFLTVIEIAAIFSVKVPQGYGISVSLAKVVAFKGNLTESSGDIEGVLGKAEPRAFRPERPHDLQPGGNTNLEVGCPHHVIELEEIVWFDPPFEKAFKKPCEDMMTVVDTSQKNRLADHGNAADP
jgi:16S rRNA G966 N2-methylase RsmD